MVRRHALVEVAWPHGAIVHENTLDTYIARLRRKLSGLPGARRSPPCTAWDTASDEAVSPFGGRPRSVRARLLLTVVVAVAAALVLMTVGFNLTLGRELSHEADTLARSRAAVEVSSLNVADGHVLPTEGAGQGRPRKRGVDVRRRP